MPSSSSRSVPADRLQLLTKIAVMYHEQGLRQPEIAERLNISQSRVSRSLKEAVALGVVRTIVVPPPGVYSDVEAAVAERFGLLDVVAVEPYSEDEPVMLRALGAAAAAYLDTTLVGGANIGISSWSSSLLAMVEAMQPHSSGSASKVVQVLGGTGRVGAEAMATRLAERLGHVLGATPMYLQAPGIVDSPEARAALLTDTNLAPVVDAWNELTLLLVGIGALEPSPLLQNSGNSLADSELDQLRALGAVGDVCLRFFDEAGNTVSSDLDNRIVGIGSDVLRRVPRKIGVAGGTRKLEAVRAAVAGGWVDVLITDLATAQALRSDSD